MERIGLNYGQASQAIFPLDNPNYTYETKFIKLQLGKTIKTFRKSKLEVLVEPGYYWVEHQLLNHYFIKPEEYPDHYQEMRDLYTQKRSFYEIALNLGVLYRHDLFKDFSVYGLASIGPMISSKDTGRLRKGFAFSDVFGIGFGFERPRFLLDARISLRHNSNADLRRPNTGHNSIGLELGVSYKLD